MLVLVWLSSVAASVLIGAYKGKNALVSFGLGWILGPVGVVSSLLSPASRKRP